MNHPTYQHTDQLCQPSCGPTYQPLCHPLSAYPTNQLAIQYSPKQIANHPTNQLNNQLAISLPTTLPTNLQTTLPPYKLSYHLPCHPVSILPTNLTISLPSIFQVIPTSDQSCSVYCAIILCIVYIVYIVDCVLWNCKPRCRAGALFFVCCVLYVVYCIVLHCIVLYCVVLYCIVVL